MSNIYQIEDLLAVGWASDELILFIRKEDRENPLCLALKVHFDAGVYHINLIQRFLKFGVYKEIGSDQSIQAFCQQKIGTAFSIAKQTEMLATFTKEVDKWEQLADKFKYREIA